MTTGSGAAGRGLRRGARAIAAMLALAGTAGGAARAQSFMPDVTFDPAIPTVETVLGAPATERITSAADIMRYFRALEDAAPDRVRIQPYAESWQGRELIYAVIGSPDRIADLDSINEDMRALTDPRRTDAAAADRLIADLPAIAWLAYGVHGDEISSPEAAMMTAYHLLAAEDDPATDAILADALVFIDPLQNPDGRDRFVNFYYDTLGLEPAGSTIAAERNQVWPGGRFNHYLFDLNRDWFALTQPETRGRVAAFLEWTPLIFVDLHEMGADTSYFFAPEAEPYNPHITQSQRAALELLGRNNARWFDRFGFDYFTREVFDALYPGYGAAWPLYHGAIGTTYEQASARGLTARRFDGTDLTYEDGVRRHFIASIATLETVAANRERLLREFYDYRASAVAEGRTGTVRAYVIPPQADQAAADKLAGILAMQGVEAWRADAPLRACGGDFPAGAYVIDLAQPAGRLARTLLEPDAALEEDFMLEQERRRARGLEVEIYDVTAWSLPLMFNVAVEACAAAPAGDFAPVEPQTQRPGSLAGADDPYAYLAPWGSAASVRLLAASLREGFPVSSADRAFTLDGRTYPAGTLVFRRGADDPGPRLAELAVETGAELVGIGDSWVTDGPSFGSAHVPPFPAPRVAIAWDRPTRSTAAGNTRFVIERQFGFPATPVRTSDLASPAMSQFDVLILPDGDDYLGVLGEDGARALGDWMRQGGVLIAMGRAARFTADPETGLSSIRRENAYREEEAETPEEDRSAVPGTILTSIEALLAAERPLEAPPDASLGVLARAASDPDHWLTAGVSPGLNVLVSGGDIYTPARRDSGVNAVSFVGPDELLASGYLWEETRAQLAFKPFAVVEPQGRGFLVTFTQDPTVRAYLDGLNVLLANAIFRGAAHARPVR